MKAGVPEPGFPAFSAQTRLLGVAPHPDDETIATGLLVQRVRACGGAVRILLLTDGDNNPWPQRWLERRLWIGPAARRRWGERRHAEILRALACLGLPPQALHALGWPDLGVTEALLYRTADAVACVADVVAAFRPDLVAMPSLDDRHPDHGSAHVLLRLALAGHAMPPPRCLVYQVHGKSPRDAMPALSGSAGEVAKKREALEAHRSQMVLSGRRMRRLAARPERLGWPATAPWPAAALPWRPPAWLRPWLRLSVVGAQGAQTWAWRDAPLRRDQAGRFQLCCAPGAAAAPRFARLALGFSTFWIFDRWGWCELSPPSAGR